jgi:hypothetical protein
LSRRSLGEADAGSVELAGGEVRELVAEDFVEEAVSVFVRGSSDVGGDADEAAVRVAPAVVVHVEVQTQTKGDFRRRMSEYFALPPRGRPLSLRDGCAGEALESGIC